MTPSTPPNAGASEGFAGFGKFVPGFDFLQNLVAQTAANAAQNGSAAAQPLPGLGSWIAPTLNVEELERRIKELKTVQFWLDQNATALKATITALEVQKMTLSTLKDMNFNMTEVAKAFHVKTPDTPHTPDSPDAATGGEAEKARSFAGLEIPATIFGHPTATDAAPVSPAPPMPDAAAAPTASAPATARVDPMQWWGALTQQFQTIAADAMKDVALNAAKTPLADSVAAGGAPPDTTLTGLAEKAAAALAASSQALADNAGKALASSTALMGKTLKHTAWPMPGAAVAGAPKTVKKAARKATAPAPVLKKPAVVGRVAVKKSAPKKSAKTPAKTAAKTRAKAPTKAASRQAAR